MRYYYTRKRFCQNKGCNKIVKGKGRLWCIDCLCAEQDKLKKESQKMITKLQEEEKEEEKPEEEEEKTE